MSQPVRRLRTRKASRLSEGTSVRALDYHLSYAGKESESTILSGPRSALRKCLSVEVAEKMAPRNRLYLGDNLGILRALRDDPAIAGQISLIYIDPPFATGASFESRDAEMAYDDGAMGAKFLEFLRQRVIVLRELLSA